MKLIYILFFFNVMFSLNTDMTNKWYVEEINLVKDYEKAFNKKTTKKYGLITFVDSDNTYSKTLSFTLY